MSHVSKLQKKSPVTVFCDLDGVLADFDAHARANGKMLADDKVNYPALDYKWWATMPAFAGAKEFYQTLSRSYQTKMLTAPTLSEDCFAGKAAWAQAFRGSKHALLDLIICPAKDKHFLAGPDRVLIDDRIKNVVEWENAGGIGIHHTGDFQETLQTLTARLAARDVARQSQNGRS